MCIAEEEYIRQRLGEPSKKRGLSREDKRYLQGLILTSSLNDLLFIRNQVRSRSAELGLLGEDE